MVYQLERDGYLLLSTLEEGVGHLREDAFKVLWVREQEAVFVVDHEEVKVSPRQVLFLAPNQQVEIRKAGKGFAFQYNQAFYCILDHDQEIGCAGLLYYGAQRTPVISLDANHQRKFELLFQVFIDEFETKDNIQESMLRMLLKRLIIICTRLLKEQASVPANEEEGELIRKFHVLVEQHFRQKQKVADYAEMLYKSPKTLSNVFAKHQEAPPLRQIQERMALEAKRLLLFTDKSIKEISWELNFEEVSHFSRFFKRMTSQTPTHFKKEYLNQSSQLSS